MLQTNIKFFGSPDYVPVNKEIEIREVRKERGILPDVMKRYERLLEIKHWRQITEFKNTAKLPTIAEWVDNRILNERGTKFFPSFVTDKFGDVFFVKTQVSNREDHFYALKSEALKLQILNNLNYPSPKFYEYGSRDEAPLAFLRLQAIMPGEGRVRPAKDWTVHSLVKVMNLIKSKTEDFDLNLLPKNFTEMHNFRNNLKIIEFVSNLVKRTKNYIPLQIKNKLERIINMDGVVRNTFIHGDMSIKNIIVKKDGSVLPVDFEFANIGFLGQDAAKLLITLKTNSDIFQAGMEEYWADGNGKVDKDRFKALFVGMVLQNLADIVWRVEYRPKNQKGLDQIIDYINGLKEVSELCERYL